MTRHSEARPFLFGRVSESPDEIQEVLRPASQGSERQENIVMRRFITDTLSIDDNELEWDFVRSSGPGGQNVNKVATAVQLRFDVRRSPSLPDDVRERLVRLSGKRMTSDGVLVIHARRFRTQEGNRQDAWDRLSELVKKALIRPRVRKPFRPSKLAKQKRLDSKKRQGELKKMRSIIE